MLRKMIQNVKVRQNDRMNVFSESPRGLSPKGWLVL